MLKLHQDALPAHLQALLALVATPPAAAPLDGSQEGGTHAGAAAAARNSYLRTVHLDLSGHAVATGQLRALLVEAPGRLGQCNTLEGLVLEGCQLAPGAAQGYCVPPL